MLPCSREHDANPPTNNTLTFAPTIPFRQKTRISLQQKARVAAVSAAANAAAQREAAENDPTKTAPATTAAAARRRDNSPLVFSGDAPPTGTTTTNNLTTMPASNTRVISNKASLHTNTQRNVARPETSSSTSSGAESENPSARGDCNRTLGKGVTGQSNREGAFGGNNQEADSSPLNGGGDGMGQLDREDMLRERERQLEEREIEIREREDAVLRGEVLGNTADAGVPSPRRTEVTVRTPASRPTMDGAEGATAGDHGKRPALPPRPEQTRRPRAQHKDMGSALLPRREEIRPASPRSSLVSVSSGSTTKPRGRRRPQSARSSRSQSFSLKSRKEEEAALIARCKALHAARRKAAVAAAAVAAAAGGEGVAAPTAENTALLKRQQDRQQRPPNRCSSGGGNLRLVRRPASACSATRPRFGSEQRRLDDSSSHQDLGNNAEVVAHQGEREATRESTRSIRVGVVAAQRGRIPTRPQSAVDIRRGGGDRPSARLRSASTSRSSGARKEQEEGARGKEERLLGAEGRGMGTKEDEEEEEEVREGMGRDRTRQDVA